MSRIKYIDGLRALAVLAVILFHFGFLPNGYLGVDIFFVISGFLITGSLYQNVKENQLSIREFYLRRIRRIIPLVLFITILSIIIGVFVMLPDDLENLAESAFATTLFANNILQAITVKDYWNVINDFKPLMHTWSLGIEEQYYFLYPVIYFIFSGRKIKYILPILIFITVISLALYFMPVFSNAAKFYYLPFRFFELSLGGITAILLKDNIIDIGRSGSLLSLLFLSIVTVLLVFKFDFIPDSLRLCLIVISTCCIIILRNRSINGIGGGGGSILICIRE
jgi:peptidoglycan/LPS O-acetylase OafA/YrhL